MKIQHMTEMKGAIDLYETSDSVKREELQTNLVAYVHHLMSRVGKENYPYSGAELSYFNTWFLLRGGW